MPEVTCPAEIIVKSDYKRGFAITIHGVDIQCTRAVETRRPFDGHVYPPCDQVES